MNLIAAFMLLLVAANFSPTVTFPFKLIDVEKESGDGARRQTKTTDILIAKPDIEFVLRIGDKTMPFNRAAETVEQINPHLPARIAIEKGCGVTMEQMATLMQLLKKKGVTNVAIVAESSA